MKLSEKLECLGFDEVCIEQHIAGIFQLLGLVFPRDAYFFYEHYVAEVSIDDIAARWGTTTKTIQRALHGEANKQRVVLGVEDWFLLLLQMFSEAEHLAGASDALISCFSQAVTGGQNPLTAPFHRSFFSVLVNAFDPHDPAESFPWTAAASRNRPGPETQTLRGDIVWPIYYPPLAIDKLPGLLSVMRDATEGDERPWLCIMLLLLAEHADVWAKTLDLLNPPLAKSISPGRRRVGPSIRQQVTDKAQTFLKGLTNQFQKNALLAILVKAPCDWDAIAREVNPQMAGALPGHRIRACAQEALRYPH